MSDNVVDTSNFPPSDCGDSGVFSSESSYQEIICPVCSKGQLNLHRCSQIDRQNDAKFRSLRQKITEKDINEITHTFGEEWKSLGRQLGLPEAIITSIDDQHTKFSERAHAMLIEHIRREGQKTATRANLIKALQDVKVGRKDIAEELQEIIFKSHISKQSGSLELFKEADYSCDIDGKTKRLSSCVDKEGQPFLVISQTPSEYNQFIEKMQKSSINIETATPEVATPNAEHTNIQEPLNGEIDCKELKILTEDLDGIIKVQGHQEHHENYDIQARDVEECFQLLYHLQNISSGHLQLTAAVYRQNNSQQIKSKYFQQLIRLKTAQKDLEERILWLKDLASRRPEMADECKRLHQMSQRCKALRKEIEMRERFCRRPLQNELTEISRTQSEPVRRHSEPVETSWRPNSSFEPLRRTPEETESH